MNEGEIREKVIKNAVKQHRSTFLKALFKLCGITGIPYDRRGFSKFTDPLKIRGCTYDFTVISPEYIPETQPSEWLSFPEGVDYRRTVFCLYWSHESGKLDFGFKFEIKVGKDLMTINPWVSKYLIRERRDMDNISNVTVEKYRNILLNIKGWEKKYPGRGFSPYVLDIETEELELLLNILG